MDHGPLPFGRYELTDLLARGGMAEVFRARARGVSGFEKVVVIKRILPELAKNPSFVEMFVNEAKIAVSLSHANIVQVFDLGHESGRYYIAMEYVPGVDLGRVLERLRREGRRMPWPLVGYVGGEVAKALDYAHRRRDEEQRPLRIVHRDVSPQNVLLGREGEVKLTDFGVAKARLAAEDVTDAGIVKGKYAYMSPEQATGEDVDARADLFSLGAVLYEAFAGKNPFLGKSAWETVRRVRRAQVPPLALTAPHVPAEVAELVERLLRPSPADRPASAARFYERWSRRLHEAGGTVSSRDLGALVLAVEGEGESALGSVPPPALPVEVGEKTPVEVPAPRRSRRPSATPDRPEPEVEKDVAVLLARAAQAFERGDPRPGLLAAERALRRAAEDTAQEVRAATWLARLLVEERRFEEANALLDGALAKATAAAAELAPEAASAELARLESEVRRGDVRAATQRLERVRAHARFADPDAPVRAELARALLLAIREEVEEAQEALERAEALADQGGSDGRILLLARWEVEHAAHLVRGAFGSATSVAERAMELAWDLDRRRDALRYAHRLGELHLRAGDDRRAFGYLRTSYDLAREEGFAALERASLRGLGCLDAMRFHSEEGLTRVERSRQAAEAAGDLEELLAATLTAGHVERVLGREAEARARYTEARALAARAEQRRVERIAKRALESLELDDELRLDW